MTINFLKIGARDLSIIKVRRLYSKEVPVTERKDVEESVHYTEYNFCVVFNCTYNLTVIDVDHVKIYVQFVHFFV